MMNENQMQHKQFLHRKITKNKKHYHDNLSLQQGNIHFKTQVKPHKFNPILIVHKICGMDRNQPFSLGIHRIRTEKKYI